MLVQAPVGIERDIEAVMRDGTVLRADVYRPQTSEPCPVIVQRTPYNKALYDAVGRAYGERGYLVVIQDIRGQFASDGVFEPWVNEGVDGYDTIEWAAALPGCTGRVGTAGTSYQGAAQWQAARMQPPHLAAMATPVTPADYYDQWVFPSGVFALSFTTTWLLNNVGQSAARRLPDGAQLATAMADAYEGLMSGGFAGLPLQRFAPLYPDDRRVAPYFFDWLSRHSERDSYWEQLSLRGQYRNVSVPVLIYEGWYDVFVDGGIENFVGMRDSGRTAVAREGTRLVVGPYVHNSWGRRVGEVDFGAEAEDTYFDATLAWFEHWLKDSGPGLSRDPAVRYFTMGTNVWNSADQWPPPGHRQTRYYLNAEYGANGIDGDGQLQSSATYGTRPAADTFVYDPANPVPSVGGNGCCYGPQSPMGPYDQRDVELREDVLVYSTEPLREPVEMTGTPRVTLWTASTAPATDFTAKLVDVHPDGTAINVSGGVVRTHSPGTADSPSEFTITMSATSIVFLVGHRIRLEISSSNFPLYDRNPNTGHPVGSSALLEAATQTVFRDRAHPSHLAVPVRARAPQDASRPDLIPRTT